MKYSTAIFDLDGTLLDTLDDLALAGNQMLREMSFPTHSIDAYKYFVGDGLRVLVERITPENTDENTLGRCCDLFSSYYTNCWDKNSLPYSGIMEMLKELQDYGVQCSVLSNKPHHFTVQCIKRFFAPGTFEYVLGQRPDVRKKPDPAGALEIAELMRVAPSACLYVGDTAVDMQTGKAAGMIVVGVLWGFREAEELMKHGADILVSQPKEIVAYLQSLQ